MIVLAVMSPDQPRMAQQIESADVISGALLKSRQDMAEIDDAFWRVQSAAQTRTPSPVDSPMQGVTAANAPLNGDSGRSVDLEATFTDDGRYDDTAAREADHSK
jgi:hypothetical protein